MAKELYTRTNQNIFLAGQALEARRKAEAKANLEAREEEAAKIKDFYDEYFAVLDLTEEFYVETIDRIIYDELLLGKPSRQSERELKTIITNLYQDGAEAVVLGCTELGMIVDTKANVLPIYDSTEIHADAGVDWILDAQS